MKRKSSTSTRREQARSRALADALGALGYPGFANVVADQEERQEHDPAVVLMAALACDQLDTRVVEALPWLVITFTGIDWDWVIQEARRRESQNRLGYIVGLALRVGASSAASLELLAQLSAIEERLFECRLDKEDTLWCKLPETDRKWLRDARPAEARQWNLLTDLRARDLSY